MAVMTYNSRMVYWRLELSTPNGWWDLTSKIGQYVSSIKVKKGISLPKKSEKKKPAAPSELEVSITSKDYMEDLFTEGARLRCYMGYDKTNLPKVFEGEIRYLPDGGAREMLNYTVKAYSADIIFSNTEMNRVFKGMNKADIIVDIAARNGFDAYTQIESMNKMPAGFTALQKGKTDMEVLDRFAKDWGCTWWLLPPTVTNPRATLYFVEEKEAHDFGDSLYNKKGLPYILGYRTDRVACNIESIDWSNKPRPGGSETQAMMESFGEFGKNPAANEYKLVALGKTWELKEPYLTMAKTDPLAFKKYVAYAGGLTMQGDGYDALRYFFRVVKGDESISRDNVPEGGGDGTGTELTIHLNEGDPYLEPPRTASLYSGVINPRVDNAHLPNWLFRYGIQNQTVARLNINETVLTFSDGRLQSELKCSLRASK